MGNGRMFLPLKAEIRKTIKKEAGDWIHVILYIDNESITTPKEMIDCLEYEPKAFEFYKNLNESEQKYYINWIYSAKQEETKIERMVKSIDRLAIGLKFYDIPSKL